MASREEYEVAEMKCMTLRQRTQGQDERSSETLKLREG